MRFLPNATIVVVVTALTAVAYWGVLDDAGTLLVSDDSAYFDFVADGFSVCELFVNRIDAVVPVIRLGYFGMHSLFDFWWPPYAVSLLACHIAAVALVGVTIRILTRSLALALALTAPLAVSFALMMGLLQNWWYVFMYSQIIALMAVILLVRAYVNAPAGTPDGRRLLGWIGLTTAVALFIMFTGAIILPATGAFALALRARLRQVLNLGITLTAALLAWLAMVWLGWLLLGNPLPGGWRYDASDSGQPFAAKVQAVVVWGLTGLYPTEALHRAEPMLGAVSWVLLAGLTVLFVAGASRPWCSERARIGLAALALLLFYAVAAARGRDILAIWHARYNSFAVIFGLLTWALTLSILFDAARRHISKRAARHVESVVLAVLVAVSVVATYQNLVTVRQSDFFTQRSTIWREQFVAEASRRPIRDCPCTVGASTRATPDEILCLAP